MIYRASLPIVTRFPAPFPDCQFDPLQNDVMDFAALLKGASHASLSPDWRMKAAQAALPQPEGAPATDPAATASQIEGGADSDPLSQAIDALERGDYD